MTVLGLSYDYECAVGPAIDWYERAFEQAPDDPQVLNLLAYKLSGQPGSDCVECRTWFEEHPEAMDEERAEKLYLRLLELDRGAGKWTITAAGFLRGLGRTRVAEEVIEGFLAEEQPGRWQRRGIGRRFADYLEGASPGAFADLARAFPVAPRP